MKKPKSNYGTEEWVAKIVSNDNLTSDDYKRFIAYLHRTKQFKAKNLLQWGLKKKFNGEWIDNLTK